VKIAQIMAGARQGGAELFFERMTIALARAGHDVLPIIRADPDRERRLLEAGLKPVICRFGGKLDMFTRPAIRRILSGHGTQIAIAWMSRAAAKMPAGPWISAGRLGGYYNLKYYGACTQLIGNTRGITDWLVRAGRPADAVHYLPNFVDDFAGAGALKRAELGVAEDAFVVLALGRLHAVKGFDTLIRAAAMVPAVQVLIAGEGPERGALERLIGALGLGHRVRLLGWREDTGALLKTADLFVSSSRHEPLGNMVLEAFSAARPVLACAAEGPGEIIRDGVDGVLAKVDDAPALALGLADLMGDGARRERLAAAGRARFEAEFAEVPVLAAWSDVLARLAG
jgi:glycosyltransferase involved in cell wall biosynthesis